MAQQTAMEQLIEWIDSDCTPMDCVMKAKELLKVEKEQIAKAWDGGNYQYFCSKITNEDFDNGYEYYEENYNKTNNK